MGQYDEFNDDNYELDTGLGDIRETANNLASAGEKFDRLGQKLGLGNRPIDSNAVNSSPVNQENGNIQNSEGGENDEPPSPSTESKEDGEDTPNSAQNADDSNKESKEDGEDTPNSAQNADDSNKESSSNNERNNDDSSKDNNTKKDATKEKVENSAKAESGIKAAVNRLKDNINPIKRLMRKIKMIILTIKVATSIATVLFFICILAAIMTILSPTSITYVFTSQYNSRGGGVYDLRGELIDYNAVYMTPEMVQAYYTAQGFNQLWNYLFSGSEETTETDEEGTYTSNSETPAQENTGFGEYNPSDEYYDSLISNLDIIESTLKAAYDQAYNEAKAYTKDNGRSWRKSKNTLNANGCGSWEETYSECNYGYLIAAATIIINEYNYKYNPEQTSWSFDKEAFEKFMSDTNNLKCLYYIDYQEKTDDSLLNKEYYSIIIYPYSIYDLFNMTYTTVDKNGNTIEFKTSTNDTWDDTKYGIDNYSFIKNQVRQIEALGNDEIYEKYHLAYKDIDVAHDKIGASAASINGTYANLADITGTNQEIVWAYLKEYGLSDIAAAGIMGNLMAENGFSTAWKGDQGSVGIAQWYGKNDHDGRRGSLANYAASAGLEKTDIKAQAQFLLTELAGMSSYYVTVNGQKVNGYEAMYIVANVQDAADAFCTCFERPANYSSKEAWQVGKYGPDSSVTDWKYTISWDRFTYTSLKNAYYVDLQKRRNYAQQFYETYAGASTSVEGGE